MKAKKGSASGSAVLDVVAEAVRQPGGVVQFGGDRRRVQVAQTRDGAFRLVLLQRAIGVGVFALEPRAVVPDLARVFAVALGHFDVAEAVVGAVPVVEVAVVPAGPRLRVAVGRRGQVGREVQLAEGGGVVARRAEDVGQGGRLGTDDVADDVRVDDGVFAPVERHAVGPHVVSRRVEARHQAGARGHTDGVAADVAGEDACLRRPAGRGWACGQWRLPMQPRLS